MANPKLAMIPTGYKAGKVYSVLPESGVGDFTFDRDSSATRVNEDGLIETMANDVPRLDYTDGGCPSLLLEPERTNLVDYSEDFSTWTVITNITETANYTVSPDGTSNGTRLQFTTNGFTANTSQVNTTQYTVTCYAKRNDNGTQSVGFFKDGSGTVDSAWSITSEWKRFTYTYTSGNASYVGIAGISGADISVYGFQLEEGEYATSYIPTNGTAKTRVEETCDGAGDASTFNDSEGVLMAEISALADDGTSRYISLTDGSPSNRIRFGYETSNNTVRLLVIASTNQLDISKQIFNTSLYNKFAIKYKQNDFSIWSNGFEIAIQTSGNTPSDLDTLNFDNCCGTDDFYGNTKQIQYFDSALTDAELETLTSWQSFSEMANGQNYTII